jgi:protease-4
MRILLFITVFITICFAFPFFNTKKIWIYEVNGVIGKDVLPKDLKPIIDKLEKDRDVKYFVLKISSPGGGVVDSFEIYHMLKSLKLKRPDLKIVAYIYRGGYSGAYLISLGSDEIVCHPGSSLGSIGVIGSFISLKELFKKIGIQTYVMRTPETKAYPTIYDDLNQEKLEELYRPLIKYYYNIFLNTVRKERHINPERYAGKIYSCLEAVEYKLADRQMYYYQFIEYLKEKLKREGYNPVVENVTPKKDWFEEMFGEVFTWLKYIFVGPQLSMMT